MPLDFAYAVHTDVGDTCVGVKINGELRPLRTELTNGDVVEVIRGPKPTAPADWRSLTVTGRARSAIRRHIRQAEKEEFAAPRPRLPRADASNAPARRQAEVSLRPALDRFAVASEAELLRRRRPRPDRAGPGAGGGVPGPEGDRARPPPRRARRIEDGQAARFYVRGGGLTPGVALHFAPCCKPVPGDRIVGIAEPDKGLAVHAIDCPELAKYEDREELWRDLQWTPEAERNTLSRRAPARHHPRRAGRAGPGLHHHRRGRRQHRRPQHAPPPFGLLRRRLRHRGEGRPPPDPHRRGAARLPEHRDRRAGQGLT